MATTSSALSPQEVVVVWQRADSNGMSGIFYSVSLNNGISFSPPQPAFDPCPYSIGGCCTQDYFDPFAASSRITGDNWIGGIDGASLPLEAFGRILVARRAAGSTLLSYKVQTIPCSSVDKPFMGVGPWWPGGPTVGATAYIAFCPWPGGNLRTTFAKAEMPTASQWPLTLGDPGYSSVVRSNPNGGPRFGKGSFPLVLPTGRLLHGSAETANTAVAEVTYSEHGGGENAGDWLPFQRLDGYQPAGSPTPIQILRVNVSMDPTITNDIPIPGNIRVNGFPSMTYDPTAPNNVLVVYGGRVASSPDTLDLFIAGSSTGGAPPQPGVLAFPPQNTYRLSDQVLRLASETNLARGSDMWAATICMDTFGRIHMIFSITHTPEFVQGTTDIKTPPELTQVHTRYAMWPSIATLASGAHPFLADLLLPDATPAVSEAWPDRGNDYEMVVSPDCQRVFIGFVCKRINTPGSTWDVYHTRIDLPCLVVADVTQDSVVNEADMQAFAGSYLAGTPPADLNHDGLNTPPDVALFMESFACQCNPP